MYLFARCDICFPVSSALAPYQSESINSKRLTHKQENGNVLGARRVLPITSLDIRSTDEDEEINLRIYSLSSIHGEREIEKAKTISEKAIVNHQS